MSKNCNGHCKKGACKKCTDKAVICSRCGKECISDGFGTGYGELNGKKYCYACCGELDSDTLAKLKPGEKVYLYLAEGKEYLPEVINWPGTLRIKCCARKNGNHNIAGIRRDVWFKHRGKNFHGVQYGNSSEICHVQVVKTIR